MSMMNIEVGPEMEWRIALRIGRDGSDTSPMALMMIEYIQLKNASVSRFPHRSVNA